MTAAERKNLFEFVCDEARTHPDYILPIHVPFNDLMCLVAHLHLVLRHPQNSGASSKIVRDICDAIIDRVEEDGMPSTARLLRMGELPEHDA